MKIRVHHRTTYHYDALVGFGTHRFYVRPREHHHLRVREFSIQCTPEARLRWVRDPMENSIALAEFSEKANSLDVIVQFEADVLEGNPFDFILEQHAVKFPFAYAGPDLPALVPCLDQGNAPDALGITEWLRRNLPNPPTDTVPLLTTLNSLIHQTFFYQRRDDPGIQTPDETIRLGSGSCRDLAVFFAAVCRRMGLAARFVSGYLYDPPSTLPGEGNRAHGSMHAWTELFLPGAGWKGFDPTNGILCSDLFIPVAVARFPETVNPIQGAYLNKAQVPNRMECHVEMTDLVP